jgi:hypothetical protein
MASLQLQRGNIWSKQRLQPSRSIFFIIYASPPCPLRGGPALELLTKNQKRKIKNKLMLSSRANVQLISTHQQHVLIYYFAFFPASCIYFLIRRLGD